MAAFIAGANFSGRSAALMERLREAVPAFFIGPYAEAALSGLSSAVADEIDIYRAPQPARPIFAPLEFSAYAARKPPTLSGGEQVLLALHCFSQSDYSTIGIDTALEQLDPRNREEALTYLSLGAAHDFAAALIDNRLSCPPGWSQREPAMAGHDFACDLAGATAHLAFRKAPTIKIESLSFHYPKARDLFDGLSLTLEPGQAYRLTGPNGAGKTTLFKLLAGVLVPIAGRITLDGTPYAPWRSGNRIFALSTQNPDHQWCGATLGEDLARRRAALARYPDIELPAAEAFAALAARLGVYSMDQHLYELPLVARKRLSWLWPLAGAMPWLMLDEPSLGQDLPTREALALAIGRIARLGYGVVFITHDDEFADQIAHRDLRLGNWAVVG